MGLDYAAFFSASEFILSAGVDLRLRPPAPAFGPPSHAQADMRLNSTPDATASGA
jgi:hypothetical protein